MSILSAVLGIILILVVLGDAFETIIFPRRVTRRIRMRENASGSTSQERPE